MRTLLLTLSLIITSLSSFAEEPPKALFAHVPDFKTWGNNSVLIKAVETQNSQKMTLESIKKADNQWRSVSGLDDTMKAMMANTAAKELASLEKTKPFVVETFLMCNQGANVAMTNKTSDYWQGDEAKFTESFKDGDGAVHIGDVEFDESSQAYLVQVSVPVMKNGKAIGAITIGVNLDEL